MSTHYPTLGDWIAHESIPFAPAAPEFGRAVDRLLAALDGPVELLGLGEPMHGGLDFLALRNRLFQYLVEAHGFSAIAVESSFPQGRLANDYVEGRGPASYDEVQEAGFSHGFGTLAANRELIEWMRQYNADPAHPVKLRFYGFDTPTEMWSTASPRRLVEFVLDYLSIHAPVAGETARQRIAPLLGEDAAWENPAAMMDPTQAIGLSPAATALRLEVDDLGSELARLRVELVAASGLDAYGEAAHDAAAARQHLAYHAELARTAPDRTARLLGMRDAAMADNLVYIANREQSRVLVFAHNSHVKRGQSEWQLGPDLLQWWPAGAHLAALYGSRYAVIGTGVGMSDTQGIAAPESGTLEARLTAAPGPGRFIPTRVGRGLMVGDLPVRTGSAQNSGYFPFTAQSLTDFDALAVLDTTE
jgi:erythromycin esterase-like protein